MSQSTPTPGSDFNYGDYMASREWAVLRERVKQRSHGICEVCHLRPGVQVHHTSYDRLGHEELEDLQHICNPCHLHESAKGPKPVALAYLNEREWRQFSMDPMRFVTGG